MASSDPPDGDSTDSFVEISESDEVPQEKDDHPQESECDGERYPVKSDQEQSRDTVQEDDPELPQKEADECDQSQDHKGETPGEVNESAQEASCQGGQHKENEISYQEDPSKPQEAPTENQPAKVQEGGEETQTMCEENRHPEETTCEADKGEEPAEAPAESEPETVQDSRKATQSVYKENGHPEETTCEEPEEHEEPVEASTESEPENLQEDKEGTQQSLQSNENAEERSYGEEHGPAQPQEPEETSKESPNKSQQTQSEETVDGRNEESKKAKYETSAEHPATPPGGDQEQEVTEDNAEESPTTCGCKEDEEPSGLEMAQPHVRSLAPAESLWTVRRDGAVTLRMEDSGPAATPPVTVPQFFLEAVRKYEQKMALCVRRADGWEGVTYSQYEQRSRAVAKGLIKLHWLDWSVGGDSSVSVFSPGVSVTALALLLGLERFHAVLILGYNSPEWFMAEIGAILAGGLAVGVDPSCTGPFCLKVALDSRAQVIMVQDPHQVQKILQVREKLPNLKAVVQWDGEGKERFPGTYTWDQLINLGSEVQESSLDEVIASQRSNQCCAVMYGSGGAAEPRGVMLSHDNVTWTSGAIGEMLGLGSEEVVVSHLPLSRMAVQMFDLWLPLCCGGTTYFTGTDAQKGSLLFTMRDARPTRFLGGPGLWEKVERRWRSLGEEATPLQKMVIGWARGKGLRSYMRPGCLPWGHALAECLVFRPARQSLGLERCTHCYAGAVPVSQNVADYFGSLGIELLALYGMNETSGVYSLALSASRRRARSGPEVAGCQSGGSPSRVQDGGALRLWGRRIFMGYLCMEEATREVLDEDGWFVTGDLGRRDEDDFLHNGERGGGPGQMSEDIGESVERIEEGERGLYMEI